MIDAPPGRPVKIGVFREDFAFFRAKTLAIINACDLAPERLNDF